MSSEAFLGFTAFNTKKITGKDTIDFIKYRNMIAEGHAIDEELFEAVLGKPLQK
jgi:6-oxo-cyclohex-1-ene-carbonyl-CoA hydrolase